MKIVCPSCQAQYEVPEVVLTSRRKMRCARCGSEWVPGDAPAPSSAPEPPDAEPIAEVAPPDPMPVAEPEPVFAPLHPAHEDDLAIVAEAPNLSWAEPEPTHHLAVEPLPEAVVDDPLPPAPVVLRPDAPVSLRRTLPDPAAIVVPPVRPGPPVVEWVVSIALVAALVVAGVMFRAPIMKAWPPSARAYAVIGLEK